MGLVWQNGVGLFSKDNLRISVDGVLTEAQSLQVAAGVEFEMEEMVTLRFGYHSNELQDTGDIMRGFSGGLSLRYADYALHYAFTPNSTIGASHRLTLEAAFGRTAEAENSSTSGRESGSQSQGSQYLLKYLK
jgi:opacity protein-like surface antigen